MLQCLSLTTVRIRVFLFLLLFVILYFCVELARPPYRKVHDLFELTFHFSSNSCFLHASLGQIVSNSSVVDAVLLSGVKAGLRCES